MKLALLVTIFFLLIIPIKAQDSEIDSLLQILTSVDEQRKSEIYNRIARLYYYDNPQKTIKYAEKALLFAEKFNNEEEKYSAFVHKGVGYSMLGNNIKAIEFHLHALNKAKDLKDKEKLARVYNELGIDYKFSANFEKSLEYYLQSLSIYEKLLIENNTIKNKKRKASVLNNIGVLYDKLGNLDKALEYLLSDYEISKQIDDKEGLAAVLLNIGVIFEEKGENEKALEYFNQSIALSEKFGYQKHTASALANIGLIYIEMEKYKTALEYSMKALNIYNDIDDKRLALSTVNNIAGIYLEIGEKQKAYKYLTDALDLGKKINAKDIVINTYQFLASYYFEIQKYKKAYEIQKEYLKQKDSLFSFEMADKIAEIQTRYEIEKKVKEIEILTRDNEIQTLKIKRKSTQVYILVIIVILIILLLLITFLMFNRRRLKQKHYKIALEKSKLLESKLKEKNEYQSKQLTTHALNMLQKNKLLQEMENELKTFAPKTDDTLKKKLNNIRRQIKRNMNTEKDWHLFKLYFEEVNENFFNILQKRYDGLTTGDQRLAALIKLNLNIKEAAAVLNISPDSLKKARYRLRKKLGLNNRENLTDFLSQLDNCNP
jgi:tetratricopeptide (TPR) repeat protein